jgi:hypothetical protein
MIDKGWTGYVVAKPSDEQRVCTLQYGLERSSTTHLQAGLLIGDWNRPLEWTVATF